MKKNITVECPNCGEKVYYTEPDIRYYLAIDEKENSYLNCKVGKKCGGRIPVRKLPETDISFICASLAKGVKDAFRIERNLYYIMEELPDLAIISLLQNKEQEEAGVLIENIPSHKLSVILNQITDERKESIKKEYPELKVVLDK